MDLFAYLLSKKSKPGETITGEGTSIALENTSANQSISMSLAPSELSQSGTPTPSNPQTVHSISGNNTIKIEGKNLFDKDSVENDKRLDGSGQPTSSSATGFSLTGYIKVKPNTQYTYSRNLTSSTYYVNVGEYTSDKTFIERLYKAGETTTTFTFTTPNNCEYIRINDATTNLNSIQLEKGNQPTTYTPYVSQTLPLNLGTNEYCKIGNYADEFYLATSSDITLEEGKWYLKKNIGKVVLDGTQGGANVGTNSRGIKYYYRNQSNKTNGGTVLSNNFEQLSSLWTLASYTNCIVTETNNKIISIMTSDDTITDLTAFNNFFSSNNTIIYYPLEKPTYTLLDNTLQTELTNIYNNALSYEGQTNISQVNSDLPFIISATISSKSEVKIDLLNYILLEDD